MTRAWRYAAVFALVLLAPACAHKERSGAALVAIDSGSIEGVVQDGIAQFKGIPYAAAPVGDLRWRAPAPPPRWDGVRKADHFGASCMQPEQPQRPEKNTSEDCLFLNVWAPAKVRGKALPVMLWIHGGAYSFGSASIPTYNGASFARDGVVLVSLNYRLGRLGFFAHPALTAESPDGPLANYGLLDAIAALQWIQRNIAAFGGDPGNVTVFGESAGATFTDLLMISPMSKGLFAKAIAQSAPAFQPWPDLAMAEGMGSAVTKSLGVPAHASAADLRAIPAATFIGKAQSDVRTAPTPIVDGRVVPVREAAGFEQGLQHRVPFINGSNSFEASLMQSFPVSTKALLNSFGKKKKEALAIYDPSGKMDKKLLAYAINGDQSFVAPARYLARYAARSGQPTYLYHFSYVATELRGKVPGAAHGSDNAFVFETLGSDARSGKTPSADDLALAAQMHDYWVNFAKTGNPNGAGLPVWPAYTEESDELLELSNDGPVVRKNFLKERLDLTEPIALKGPSR